MKKIEALENFIDSQEKPTMRMLVEFALENLKGSPCYVCDLNNCECKECTLKGTEN